MKSVVRKTREEMIVSGIAKRHSVPLGIRGNTPLERAAGKPAKHWLEDMHTAMDKDCVSSLGQKWTREDLYRG
jgi:hypothetical protein